MKVDCIYCGYEINLDHRIFDDYTGRIKCFSCGAMMEINTKQGLLCSVMPLEIGEQEIVEERREVATL
jgi:hypothetical protein